MIGQQNDYHTCKLWTCCFVRLPTIYLYDHIRHGLFAKLTAKYEGFIHSSNKIYKLKWILGCEDDIMKDENHMYQ